MLQRYDLGDAGFQDNVATGGLPPYFRQGGPNEANSDAERDHCHSQPL